MSTFACPCCGGSMMERPDMAALEFMPLPKKEREILEYLMQRHPKRTSMRSLVGHLYGADPDGGPLRAEDSISVMTSRLRTRLKAAGWTISNGKNEVGRGLRLEPVKAA